MYNALTTGEIRKILESGDREKIAQIDKEDLEIFYENEGQRTLYSPEGIKNLYMGICKEAVDEYKKCHFMTLFNDKPRPKSDHEKEFEEFFGSEFFLTVTGLRNKQQAIEHIENTMREERKKKLMAAMVK